MKERLYQVDLYQRFWHGQYGYSYHGICSISIHARNKMEAKENALRELVGEKASEYNFPIEMEHAPEYECIERHENFGTYRQIAPLENHIINEYDIAQSNITADVTRIDE